MATSASSAVRAQYEPAAMIRGSPAMALKTATVSCLEGLKESQNDAVVSAGARFQKRTDDAWM